MCWAFHNLLLANASEDYSFNFWHDSEVCYANDCLSAFDDDDWQSLITLLPEQSELWQWRLMDCIDCEHPLQCVMAIVVFLLGVRDESFWRQVDINDCFLADATNLLVEQCQSFLQQLSALPSPAGFGRCKKEVVRLLQRQLSSHSNQSIILMS